MRSLPFKPRCPVKRLTIGRQPLKRAPAASTTVASAVAETSQCFHPVNFARIRSPPCSVLESVGGEVVSVHRARVANPAVGPGRTEVGPLTPHYLRDGRSEDLDTGLRAGVPERADAQ